MMMIFPTAETKKDGREEEEEEIEVLLFRKN